MLIVVYLRFIVEGRGIVTTKEEFAPSLPFHCFYGLVGMSSLPSLHGFYGYAVGSEEFLPSEPMAHRRDGYIPLDGVNFLHVAGILFGTFDIRILGV